MKTRCMVECNKKDFCDAWCIVDSECILTNNMISPRDELENPDDRIPCYTNRRLGNHVLKSTITSSGTFGEKEGVLKAGIMNFNQKLTIATLKFAENPYFLFEFESEILIKTIRLMNGMKTDDNRATDATKFYIGSTMSVPPDFSQLELVGSWGFLQPFQWKVLTLDPPKIGKFFVIHESDGTRLQVPFIEIFS